MVKNLILGIRPIGPKIKPQIVFSNIWRHQSLDIMFSYHHLQYQIQSYNDPILRKLSHGRMDRQTDRETDRQTVRRTGVISQDVVQLMLSIQ